MMRPTPAHKAATTRPANNLLRNLSDEDLLLIQPYLEIRQIVAGQVLTHPGDPNDALHFPCGPNFVSLAVPVDEDREVDSTIVGSEGVVSGFIVSALPTFSRTTVIVGGEAIRLPVRRFAPAMQHSATFRPVFAQYSIVSLSVV
ncbi:hypothetical protein IVA98_07825 [Bradyrhizobium sp. 160]|jgi:hypothetical protein|uniref:hypothetical protein n=1 Tax=unclassified Bradyrhizobium TaxID=2631580 RepID=UPI001FF713C1|nr:MULTISPECIES: hypothetical protein [unclassified Bradyrhizobium]MCK1542412.1 hypothetical protein [Bradyrhizobium sp. 179]MCK1623156.1 hypothetical protein [Bradyrhizobium sp. 160]